MADDGSATSSGMKISTSTKPVSRGRYAKFNGSMDVLLLETLRMNNPFTAKHGTRLQMWQTIAETLGMELFKNPGAYSWHTCRDRVSALMKMYADGKHDKLFKHGSMEDNSRKETILRELNALLARKNQKLVERPAVEAIAKERVPSGRGAAAQKRRKVDISMNAVGSGNGRAGSGGSQDSTTSERFRARVLELIENKIQFDMDQRVKETELREQEFELQKRFLEYLQSK